MAITVEKIETVTATDDITGEKVDASELTAFDFAFNTVRGTVTLTAASLAELNQVPQFAALVKAASASKKTTSGKSEPKVIAGAHGWERRAVGKAMGATVKDTGGQVPAEAEAKFEAAIAAGYKPNGAAKLLKNETDLAAFNKSVAEFVKSLGSKK